MSYTLVLGPNHPAWRGAQRFTATISGERVREIEYSSDHQVPEFMERLARLQPSDALARISSVCSSCAYAHALAYSRAYELLAGSDIPMRAHAIRCAIVELERVVAHLEGVVRLLWALGMEPHEALFRGFAQQASDALLALTGSHLAVCILPGGMLNNLTREQSDQTQLNLAKLNRQLYAAIERLIDHHALLARTVDVATLPRVAAEQFGVRGPMARASGIAYDTRVDQPYEPYPQLAIRTITQENGDVYARLVVLMLEAYESVKLVEQTIRDLPHGAWNTPLPDTLAAQTASVTVEAPHGPLRYTLEANGMRLIRVAIEPPRQFDRLLVRTLISGALVDDLAMIIASANQCVACSTIQ